VVGLALTQVASAATPRPVISQLTVSPSSLPSAGGTVQVTAAVANGRGCEFRVLSYATSHVGVGSTKISAGACNYTFNVPANDSATTMYVAVSLEVPNLNAMNPFLDAQRQVTISVAPNISNVTTSSTTTTTFPKTTGNTITVPAGPDALLAAGPHIWVASCEAGAVTEIDAATHQVIQEINNPQYGFVCPDALALVDNNIWVTDVGNNSITVISASTGAWVQTLAGPGIVSPGLITFTGSQVWVVSDGNSPIGIFVSEFQPSGALIRVVSNASLLVGPTCIVSTGADVWVTDPYNSQIKEFNAHTGKYLRRADYGGSPVCASYHAGAFWVSEAYANDPLDEFSASTGALLREVPNAGCAGNVVFTGRALFAECDGNYIQKFTQTGKFVKPLFRVSGHRWVSEFGAMVLDGNNLWVTNNVGPSVYVLPIH